MALGPTTYAIHVTCMSTRCSVKSVCSVCTVFPVVSHSSRRTESGNWEREPANPPKKKSHACLYTRARNSRKESAGALEFLKCAASWVRTSNACSSNAMSIKRLPEDVAAQIKSSVVISSLNTVVYGLVKNSLDAEASKVNIFVDYRRGNCSVEDDGYGIPPADFRQEDGLGKLHCE